MRKTIYALGLLIAFVSICSSCDDEENDDSTLGSDDELAGVDNSTAISELSSQQAQDICEASAEFIEAQNVGDFICTFEAIAQAFDMADGDTPTAESCQTAYQDCLNQPVEPEQDPSLDVDQCATQATAVGDCDLPVSAFQDCLNGMAALINNLKSQFSCETIADVDPADLNGDDLFVVPDACKQLSTCGVEVIGDGDDGPQNGDDQNQNPSEG